MAKCDPAGMVRASLERVKTGKTVLQTVAKHTTATVLTMTATTKHHPRRPAMAIFIIEERGYTGTTGIFDC